MKAAWIVLALMVANGTWADSQPPAPTTTKEEGRPPQKTAQNKGQATKTDQHGTEERPLFIRVTGVPIVEVQGRPQAEQKAAQTTNKKDDDTPQQWWLRPDALTAWGTLGLFVVGLATAIVFICQSILLRRQVREMVKATNVAIGVQIPRLLLSHLDFGDMGAADFDAKLQSPKIDARVTNYGSTFAVPKFQSMEIVCATSLPDEPDYTAILPIPFAGMTIEKGNEWAFVESADRRFFSPEEIKAIKSGGKFLWVYGFISYQDFLDTLHERRFCQRLYIVESGGYAFAEDRSTPQKYTKSY